MDMRQLTKSYYYSDCFPRSDIYCDKELYKIWTFINTVKSYLPYDVIEHIVNKLKDVLRDKRDYLCIHHMRSFDCLNYDGDNIRSFNVYAYSLLNICETQTCSDVFRIKSMCKKKTRYGYGTIATLCTRKNIMKCWLPQSAVTEVQRELKQDPYDYKFDDNGGVYFRIKDVKCYKSIYYATIVCIQDKMNYK